MRSIENNTSFYVSLTLNDAENSENNNKICSVKLTDELSYGEKIKVKYELNNYCSDSNNFPCPVDLTICTQICGLDFEFGKVEDEVEGLKLKTSFNGIDIEIYAGVEKEDDDHCLDLYGTDGFGINLSGEYCNFGWGLYYYQSENDNEVSGKISYDTRTGDSDKVGWYGKLEINEDRKAKTEVYYYFPGDMRVYAGINNQEGDETIPFGGISTRVDDCSKVGLYKNSYDDKKLDLLCRVLPISLFFLSSV